MKIDSNALRRNFVRGLKSITCETSSVNSWADTQMYNVLVSIFPELNEINVSELRYGQYSIEWHGRRFSGDWGACMRTVREHLDLMLGGEK